MNGHVAALATLTVALFLSQPILAGDARPSPLPVDSADDLQRAADLREHALPGAQRTVDRLLAFLEGLSSTDEITSASVGKAMGAELGPDHDNGPGWTVYRSPDIGQGWNYGVQHSDAETHMKSGFRFWLFNADDKAKAAPVCALPLSRLRTSLKSHGWNESPMLSEIGSVLAIQFYKGDIVLALTPRDGADVFGTACVLSLQTSDGR